MSKASVTAADFKKVRQVMDSPLENIVIEVAPAFWAGGVFANHTVLVRNNESGNGQRSDLRFAELRAKAILKAIRAYRRKNKSLMDEQESN